MMTIWRLPVGLILAAIVSAGSSWATEHSDTLSVEINSEGVGMVNALLILSSPPSHVHDILTDYAGWPALFLNKPTINSIVRDADRTVVDMDIPAFLFPFELHLVIATQEEFPNRIETHLVKGDFTQYEWIWDLSPIRGGTATQATMVYKVAPIIWAPEWILQWALQSELEGHFERIRQQLKRRFPE